MENEEIIEMLEEKINALERKIEILKGMYDILQRALVGLLDILDKNK